jgi:hypothetical protein
MEDLPKELRDQMHFVFASEIRQVLETAIVGFPQIGAGENGHERVRRRRAEKAAASAQA